MGFKICYPALYRQDYNVCTGASAQELVHKLKTLQPLIGDFDARKPGILLDAAGKRFDVSSWGPDPSDALLDRLRCILRGALAKHPLIEFARQLSLEEFKHEIRLAVLAFGQAASDADLVMELQEPLAGASTFAEALAAIPEPI